MKLSTVLIVAVVLLGDILVQAVPAIGHGALTGYCNTNNDCNRDECCVSLTSRRGKRGTGDNLGLHRFARGKCEKFGTNKSSCLVNNKYPSDIYEESCPCRAGLSCVGNGVFTVPQGETGFCQRQRDYPNTRG